MAEPGIREIALAALLHDIGKFAQRAGAESLKSADIEALLAPKARFGEVYSHRHVLYSHGFVGKYLKGVKGMDPSRAALLAARHHAPSSTMEWIVAVADRIASAHDRRDEEGQPEGQKGWERVVSTRLGNVLDRIDFEGRPFQGSGGFRLLPLEPVNFLPIPGNAKNTREGYAELWKLFVADMERLTQSEPPDNQFDAGLDALLERYLWCMPSSTMDGADISLYDHSRLAAAFASVLFKHHEEEGSLLNEAKIRDEGKERFLFVSGDISGIQSRIYSLEKTSQAAKLLRARSFEIRILSDSWSAAILEALGLPAACRLMNAGGRFLLLAQNTQGAREKLESLRRDIESSFLKLYLGELSLNLSFEIAASVNDLRGGKAARVFSRIADEAGKAKLRKFRSVLLPDGEAPGNSPRHVLEEEYKKILETGICPLCGKNAADTEHHGEKLCKACELGFRWGAALPKASWIQFGKQNRGDLLPSGKRIHIPKSGEKCEFRDTSIAYSVNDFKAGLGRLGLPYYVPLRAEDSTELDGKGEPAFRKGEPLGFKELGAMAGGNGKIAMLKADLDNLGAAFTFGMGASASLSRQASLSRNLDYFFSTWVDELLKNDYRNIYLVYSGGDELCAVGPWDSLIEFAFSLHEGFIRLTGGNPSLSISAGLVLASPSLPVGSMAQAAREALERAKERRSAGGRLAKNAISLFGATRAWKEARELIEEGKRIISHMAPTEKEESRLSAATVRKLLLYAESEEAFRAGRGRRPLWRSALSYTVSRNIKDPGTREWFLGLALKTIQEGTVRIPVEYALHTIRNKA